MSTTVMRNAKTAPVGPPNTALQTLKDEIHRVLTAARLHAGYDKDRGQGYCLDHGTRPPISLYLGTPDGIGAPTFTPTEPHEQALRAAGLAVERRTAGGGTWVYLRVWRPTGTEAPHV